MKIATPGSTATHQAVRMYSLPSAMMLPQDGVGGWMPIPCPRPVLQHARDQPLTDEPHDAPVPNPVLYESDDPLLVHRPEEVPEIGVQHLIHVLPREPLVKSCQCVMSTAPRPCAVGEASKLGLVDGVQDCRGRPLHDLVFQCHNANRTLLPVLLRDVRSPHRLRAVGSASHSVREIAKVLFQRLAVVFPRLAIGPWCGIPLEAVGRRSQRVDGLDVVQQRGEPCSFLLLRCLPYPPQCLLHAPPALCPERGGLRRVPLGQPPSLPPLRHLWRGLGQDVPPYYGAV